MSNPHLIQIHKRKKSLFFQQFSLCIFVLNTTSKWLKYCLIFLKNDCSKYKHQLLLSFYYILCFTHSIARNIKVTSLYTLANGTRTSYTRTAAVAVNVLGPFINFRKMRPDRTFFSFFFWESSTARSPYLNKNVHFLGLRVKV